MHIYNKYFETLSNIFVKKIQSESNFEAACRPFNQKKIKMSIYLKYSISGDIDEQAYIFHLKLLESFHNPWLE